MADDPGRSIPDLLYRPSRRSSPGHPGGPGNGHTGDSRPDRTEAILTPASDIRPERIEWAWQGRIPFGAVTLLVGKPGLGKSTILLDICARLTRGQLEGDAYGRPVGVVVASAEDHRSATIVPRLTAAGADLPRVHFIDMDAGTGMKRGIILPDDLPAIENQVCEVGARMLIIDPLVAHLPGTVNSWRDQDVRRALAPLKQMAESLSLAVVAVVHLNKNQSDDVFTRVSGSVGLTAAARSMFLVARDPEDEAQETRILAHAKSNVSTLAPALRFRVEGREVEVPGSDAPISTSGVSWLGEAPDVRATDLLSRESPEKRSVVRGAKEWLQEFLAGGPREAREVYAEAQGAGIARRTLDRAKSQIGVQSRKDKDTFQSGWSWSLPDAQDRQGRHEDRQNHNLGDLRAEPFRKALSNKAPAEDCQVSHIGNVRVGRVEPPAPCYTCDYRRYWRLPNGPVRCGVCHPAPKPLDVAWLVPLLRGWWWIRADKRHLQPKTDQARAVLNTRRAGGRGETHPS